MNHVFKRDFEHRLWDLNMAIENYFLTGRSSNLFPCLFKVFSYLWTDYKALLKK